MSKSLVKLIDLAILPAALLVVSKFLGLTLAITIFRLDWDLQNVFDGFWLIRPAVSAADLIVASTYSDLIMYMLLSATFSFVLVQATHFHDTHIKPKTLLKLHNYNLTGLIKGTFEIYHTATVWLIFNWIATAIILVDIVAGTTQMWVGAVAVISATMFTTILLQDVYREIEISQRNFGKTHALN